MTALETAVDEDILWHALHVGRMLDIQIRASDVEIYIFMEALKINKRSVDEVSMNSISIDYQHGWWDFWMFILQKQPLQVYYVFHGMLLICIKLCLFMINCECRSKFWYNLWTLSDELKVQITTKMLWISQSKPPEIFLSIFCQEWVDFFRGGNFATISYIRVIMIQYPISYICCLLTSCNETSWLLIFGRNEAVINFLRF